MTRQKTDRRNILSLSNTFFPGYTTYEQTLTDNQLYIRSIWERFIKPTYVL